ncbi:DUF4760 domain-containing protein [Marinomonas shanghaiensis]|jgi:hypothetical protein|uniref:DUF4760 domain-containing protein n=1 Tax=Marinomonas shanghaiensis TaxID=2202418 RepID=UPI000DB9C3EE|nr:DUF4760 domain-containing protein [Marinomonas shanghaiensis]
MELTLLQTYLSQIDVDTCILAATALAALYSIRRNTVINRRRATVDLVLHQKNDNDLKAANDIVNPLLRAKSITKYSDQEYKNSDQRKAILTVLNNYEFIATGIKEEAFDFRLYKRMRYNMVVRDWVEFEPFVIEMRKTVQHPTLYQEFESLVKRLKKSPLKSNKKH